MNSSTVSYAKPGGHGHIHLRGYRSSRWWYCRDKTQQIFCPQTIGRIERAVTAKGMQIFARINHGGEAKKAGLAMRPTELLIFGNPKGAGPLVWWPSLPLRLTSP